MQTVNIAPATTSSNTLSKVTTLHRGAQKHVGSFHPLPLTSVRSQRAQHLFAVEQPETPLRTALCGGSVLVLLAYLLGRRVAKAHSMAAVTGRRSMALRHHVGGEYYYTLGEDGQMQLKWGEEEGHGGEEEGKVVSKEGGKEQSGSEGEDAQPEEVAIASMIGRRSGSLHSTPEEYTFTLSGDGMELKAKRGISSGAATAQSTPEDYIAAAMAEYENDNTYQGYYIAREVYEKVVKHLAHNLYGVSDDTTPLILTISGARGEGKTFQCDLIFRKLGISPVVMAARRLEAGEGEEPAQVVRQRYRESSTVRGQGRLSCLFINDLDTGAGPAGEHMLDNQMVHAALSQIADHPTKVPMSAVEVTEIPRIPIVATSPQLSSLYAPLIQKGQLEDFVWIPTQEDKVGICRGIFKDDPLTADQVTTLVNEFPGQPLDFFRSLRTRIFDLAVQDFVEQTGVKNLSSTLVNSETQPTIDVPPLTVEKLLECGQAILAERTSAP